MKLLADHSQDEIKAAVADRYGLVATTPAAKFHFPVERSSILSQVKRYSILAAALASIFTCTLKR